MNLSAVMDKLLERSQLSPAAILPVSGEVEGARVAVSSLKAASWCWVCMAGLSFGRGLYFGR